MRLELAWLLGRLKRPERIKADGLKIWTGALEGCEVVLACCGIGPVHARGSMDILFGLFEVGRVLHFGVCGALADNLSSGLVVTAKSVAAAWEPAAAPIELSGENEAPLAGFPPACGRFVSNALPVFQPRVKSFLRERFQADCVDMESWEVVQSCHVRGIPVTVLKAVSDSADSAPAESFRRHAAKAALAAQEALLNILRRTGS